MLLNINVQVLHRQHIWEILFHLKTIVWNFFVNQEHVQSVNVYGFGSLCYACKDELSSY